MQPLCSLDLILLQHVSASIGHPQVYLVIEYISGEHSKNEYQMCEDTQPEIYKVICTYVTIKIIGLS
jgi:hypothetical protein